MKQGLLTVALALALCLSLTSCGMNNTKGQPGTETDNSSVAGDNAVTDPAVPDNGPGGGALNDDFSDDAVGNAAPDTNDNSNTQARMTTRSTSKLHRSAYDYLKDGRYAASPDGKVLPRSGDLGAELTQGARDLIRDAKELGKDLANDAGSAVKSGMEAARSTGRAAKDTMRDKLT